MENSGALFVGFFLMLILLSVCSAQHWSYGFQPGGKRDADNLMETFQEITSKMNTLGELQHFECNVPRQHPILRGLKEVLASLIEGETAQKKV
ncbi:progonadoliberin-1 [Elgaria multicarinata webbii]|uniref:progonadoliberin-1 n=1 Tax=Elgaria multicarinata webbii TaxID=159646 RepID=UPI002FCCC3C9